jgi:hypothetical protein
MCKKRRQLNKRWGCLLMGYNNQPNKREALREVKLADGRLQDNQPN